MQQTDWIACINSRGEYVWKDQSGKEFPMTEQQKENFRNFMRDIAITRQMKGID